ncbi:methyltransferase-like protein 2 [Sarcoptes scabiei]|uniref:U6 small nuclear RNA (adenine-(43)-N(6))-methyltransferase n=1 Tax=Sarcoptes scabiei TaxID=52283 RepID=A0A131ZXM6_SARSC|nr:methyltransferase-like protein 2 [Sarcoptes scabiei]
MAFNQFMHPRNIYRKRPDYKELASLSDEFRQYIYETGSNGNFTIDFTDQKALWSLTKTLLHKDFNLDVQIADNRLIPTLPMRLNYIHWIEDLLQHCKIFRPEINLIDIGTGCCAIFPLLGCRLHKDWKFYATEIDDVNLEYAKLNVQRNGLESRIKIYDNRNSEHILKTILTEDAVKFHVSMTNPPFFDDFIEENSNKMLADNTSDVKSFFHKHKTSTASPIEAVHEGGESKFIKQIIKESIDCKQRIDLHTVMIGRKKNFLELKSHLKELVEQSIITGFCWTEFCQGNTKRWGLAWTFCRRFNLTNAPKIKFSLSKPLILKLSNDLNCCDYEMNFIANHIEYLLRNDLEIDEITKIETHKKIEFDIKSQTNNWQNQRQKRRLAQRMIGTECNIIEQRDNEDEYQTISKRKLSDSVEFKQNFPNQCKKRMNFDYNSNSLTFLLHCGLMVKREKQDIIIKMVTKEMSLNKDSTYQLFQYFKNKLV